MADSDEQEGLWFEDPPAVSSRRAPGRRMWVVAASVVCIAALAVPVAVALSSSGPTAKPCEDRVIARHPRCRRTTTDLRPERHHELRQLQRHLRV